MRGGASLFVVVGVLERVSRMQFRPPDAFLALSPSVVVVVVVHWLSSKQKKNTFTPASLSCSPRSSSGVMHCFSAVELEEAPGGSSTTAWLTLLDERATTRAPASESFSWRRARAASSSAVELAEARRATTPARGSGDISRYRKRNGTERKSLFNSYERKTSETRRKKPKTEKQQ